ncbi:MAG: hypothetical protein PHU79_07965, partial [Oscillospiraceae bacterium]|nr:hypothetical protein [Oscillospiraceae bacterium]
WLLNDQAPLYRHIPMLLASDGRRLSKRDHDLGLQSLRQDLPDARPLVGLLAYLCGQLPAPRPLTPRELLPLFSWDKVPKEDIRVPKAWYEAPLQQWDSTLPRQASRR